MAIAQPAFVSFESGQDGTWTVALDPAEDITGWQIEVHIRAYNGGTALVSKQSVDGNTEIEFTDTANGVFVAKFSAADLALTNGPGAYVIQAHRVNTGFVYPITDPSCLLLRPADSTTYPTITNLGEYAAHALVGLELNDALSKQLIQLLFAAEDWVKRYCGRDFVYRATQTEYYDGTGTQELALNRFPVVVNSVTVYEDYGGYYGQASGAFAASTQLTSGSDFAVPITPTWGDGLNHSGIIKRIGRVWPYQHVRPIGHLSYGKRQGVPGAVKVTYTAGYQLMPHALKRAVWDLTTIMAELAPSGRLYQSESGEGYSYSQGPPMFDGDVPWSIMSALAPFRRLIMG